MRNFLLVLYTFAILTSCSALDGYLTMPLDSGATGADALTIGDAAAHTIDSISDNATTMVSTVTTALTGNPVLGGTAAAIIASLLALGSQRLRRKKQGGGTPPTA